MKANVECIDVRMEKRLKKMHEWELHIRKRTDFEEVFGSMIWHL